MNERRERTSTFDDPNWHVRDAYPPWCVWAEPLEPLPEGTSERLNPKAGGDFLTPKASR